MARGELPTGMFLTTVSVEPSMALTMPLPNTAAYTFGVVPEGSAASARMPLACEYGGEIVATRLSVDTSIAET